MKPERLKWIAKRAIRRGIDRRVANLVALWRRAGNEGDAIAAKQIEFWADQLADDATESLVEQVRLRRKT